MVPSERLRAAVTSGYIAGGAISFCKARFSWLQEILLRHSSFLRLCVSLQMARWCVTAAAVLGFALGSGSPSQGGWQGWLLSRARCQRPPSPRERCQGAGALTPSPPGQRTPLFIVPAISWVWLNTEDSLGGAQEKQSERLRVCR